MDFIVYFIKLIAVIVGLYLGVVLPIMAWRENIQYKRQTVIDNLKDRIEKLEDEK